MSATVITSALILLLCMLGLSGGSRCTCPPHFFDEYSNTRGVGQQVADGLLTQLLMLGTAESGNLLPDTPEDYENFGSYVFRSALKVVAELHNKASTWDDLSHVGALKNGLINAFLSGLVGDVCQWVDEVVDHNSNFTCSIDGLLHLYKRLHLYETVYEAETAVESYKYTKADLKGYQITKNRCAWINHRLLSDCRPICSPDAPHTDTDRMTYYGTTFGCAGDFRLCSNTQ